VNGERIKRIFVSSTAANGKTMSCRTNCRVVNIPVFTDKGFETVEHIPERVYVCEGLYIECLVDLSLGFEEAEDLLSDIIEVSVLGDDATLYARGPMEAPFVMGRADAD